MKVSTLFFDIKAQGLDIQIVDGNLHVSPRERITDHIRAQIRIMKNALVDFIDAYEERAAIMEFDAGMSRQEAEKAAFDALTKGTQHDDTI